MANAYRPKGLSPVQNGDGTQWSAGATLFCIPADSTNTYAIGDIVQAAPGSDADGVLNVIKWFGAQAGAGATATAVTTVGLATLPLGVIVGIRVADPSVSLVGNSLSLEKSYIPANTGVAHYVYVCTDPQTVYELSTDNSTVWASAVLSGNAGVTVTQTQAFGGANAIQYSTTVASGLGTGSGLPLQVLGLAQRPDNAVGAAMSVYVRFNVHNYTGNATGRTGV